MREFEASVTARLARRLGLDRNPLRRRTDRMAVRLTVLLVVVFLAGAPLLSITAVGWAGRAAATEQQAVRAWDQVSAAYPVQAGAATADTPVSPPSHRAVVARETAAAVIAVATLGTVLLCLAWAGRWVIDRRRLAAWAAAWDAVGPKWTRRFRSLG